MPRVSRLLPASGIRDIFDKAKEMERSGRRILHLEIGRPDWKMPPGAIEGAKAALDEGLVHYIENRGLLELRQVIAREIEATAGVSFDPATEIIVTTGASEAVSMAGLALLGEGDEVIVPEPAWNHYRAVAEMCGATPISLPLRADEGFAFDPERFEALITPRTRLLILNTPANPTGAVQSADRLRAVAEIASRRGIAVLSDEVYQDFVYEGEHVSIGRFLGGSPELLYVNSFSKSFGMTGWRLGYIAATRKVSDALNRVHQYLTVCGVPFAQKAAAAALNHPERAAYTAAMRAEFATRRQVWLDALPELPGFELVPPSGGFYLFPRFDVGIPGREFCLRLLAEYGLAMVPGDVFGPDYGDHARISYGGPLATQHAAADTLKKALNDCRR